eukprot:gene18676-biopygen6934
MFSQRQGIPATGRRAEAARGGGWGGNRLRPGVLLASSDSRRQIPTWDAHSLQREEEAGVSARDCAPLLHPAPGTFARSQRRPRLPGTPSGHSPTSIPRAQRPRIQRRKSCQRPFTTGPGRCG